MPIAQHLGFEITDVAAGRFEITQPFRRELSFREGTFQAGPIGTLADMAAACAGATMLPEGWAASTIDYTLKLLTPAVGEKVVARGRLLNILEFPAQFSPPAEIVTLDRNYRSTQPILAAANGVIDLAKERFTKNLWTERTSGANPHLITVRDESDQARCLVERILENRQSG